MLNREGNILDKTGCTQLPGASHRWEDTRTDCPILGLHILIGREVGRNIEFELLEALLDAGYILLKLLLRVGFGLGEHRRKIFASCICHRSERLTIQKLGTMHNALTRPVAERTHSHHRTTSLVDCRKVEHCRGFIFIVTLRAHCNLRHKTESTLRADHKMGYDIKRIIILKKWQKIQSHHILYRILFAYALGERLIRPHLIAQSLDGGNKIEVSRIEDLATAHRACVEQRAIAKDDAHRLQHLVAIGVGATVHSRGVVHHNTAHHSTLNRRRIGRETIAIGFEHLAHLCPYHTWLQADSAPTIEHLITLPIFTRYHKYRIAHRLPRKACSGGTEREGHFTLGCRLDNTHHLALVLGSHHNLRHQTVETSIGTPRQTAEVIGIDSLGGNERPNRCKEFAMLIGHIAMDLLLHKGNKKRVVQQACVGQPLHIIF